MGRHREPDGLVFTVATVNIRIACILFVHKGLSAGHRSAKPIEAASRRGFNSC